MLCAYRNVIPYYAKSKGEGIFASHPGVPGLILGIAKNFSLDVAEIY